MKAVSSLEAAIHNFTLQIQCGICLNVYAHPVSLPCSHYFCKACILEALKIKSTCPICKKHASRRSLRSDSVIEDISNASRALCLQPTKWIEKGVQDEDDLHAGKSMKNENDAVLDIMISGRKRRREETEDSKISLEGQMQATVERESEHRDGDAEIAKKTQQVKEGDFQTGIDKQHMTAVVNVSDSLASRPDDALDKLSLEDTGRKREKSQIITPSLNRHSVTYKPGSLVCIKSRTWSGSNKEGGTAIVTGINCDGSYNVKYVLDLRRESNVILDYITPADAEITSNITPGKAVKKRIRRGAGFINTGSLSSAASLLHDACKITMPDHPRPVLLLSGFSDTRMNTIQKWAYVVNAKLCMEWSPDVTHLVVACMSKGSNDSRTSHVKRYAKTRSLKYLQALVSGRWIVSEEWLEESANRGKIISEAEFEVNGYLKARHIVDAPAACRRLRERNLLTAAESTASKLIGTKLFASISYFLYGNYSRNQPSASDMHLLLQLGDGNRVYKLEEAHKQLENIDYSSQRLIIVCDQTTPAIIKEARLSLRDILRSPNAITHSVDMRSRPTICQQLNARFHRFYCSSREWNAAPASLIAYGERILRSPNPDDKFQLTLQCKRRWDAEDLPLISVNSSHWPGDPPQYPAREKDSPTLYAPKDMPSMKDLDASISVAMLHSLAHIELGAIDNYWDTIVRFDPEPFKLPKAFYDDFLNVAADEARHFKMVQDRLHELNSYYGALPAHRALLEHANDTADSLAARIAVVPLVQEARGLDSGDRLVHKLMSERDPESARIVEIIVEEERNHVACGIKWFRYICQQLQLEPIPYFHKLVLANFPEGLPGPFDVEARLAADMEKTWYQPLETKGFRTSETAEKKSAISLGTQGGKRTVIIAGSVWPERTSSAAGVRTMDMIKVLQDDKYQVVCVSPSRYNHHTSKLQEERGISCVQVDPNTDDFKKLLLETTPEAIIFDRFIAEEMYGWQAQKYAPETLRVLDLQDIHFLRKARELLVKKTHLLDLKSVLQQEIDVTPLESQVIRELASIHRSDLTFYVSDFERELLIDRFQVPSTILAPCSFFLQELHASPTAPTFEDRKHIAFVGNFKHSPNYDGINWFKNTILPLYHKQMSAQNSKVEVHVYGAFSDSHKVRKLEDPKHGLHVKGHAQDIHETLKQYRLSIAPLRFGAGIKGKIADSWLVGTPCITTCVGAEGMPFGGVGAKAVANDEHTFARSMQNLYSDPVEWRIVQRHGLEQCYQHYSAERNGDAFKALLQRRIREKQARPHSEMRWFSKILWSEKFRATEYMSRYLQAKKLKGAA